MIEELERKYIKLILNRCLNFDQNKSLMIHCDLKEHVRFAELVKAEANKMGIMDVCIHVTDLDDIHKYLQENNSEDIVLNSLIDRSDWDIYSKKGAPLLFFNTVVPGLMDDISSEKMKKWIDEREKSTKYYRANVSKYTFPWCIIALPNERWAKSIYGDVEDAYDKLYMNIMKMCMIDQVYPVQAWEEYIKKNNYYKNMLNSMGIRSLHYTNSLGTDFTIGLPEACQWTNLDKTDAKGGIMISNMPSYEIFTTPDCRTASGIVYSSRPLIYNECRIDDFSLEFRNGRVVACHAKKGLEVLKQLIFENENADRLGEVALVPYDSPISNTGLVFNATLFDENASCHLALGRGYANCYRKDLVKTDEDRLRQGYNDSIVHVDFMIGTSDLEIEADTKNGKKLIFKNGNFNI